MITKTRNVLIRTILLASSLFPAYSHSDEPKEVEKPVIAETPKEESKVPINKTYVQVDVSGRYSGNSRTVNLEEVSSTGLMKQIIGQLGDSFEEYKRSQTEEKKDYTFRIEEIIDKGLAIPISDDNKNFFNVNFNDTYFEFERKGEKVDTRGRVQYRDDEMVEGITAGLGFSFKSGARSHRKDSNARSKD